MNVEFARTFLAVADTGSFVAAAERLHVTQSTVSARIRALEESLGRSLFIRNKKGASLTSSGSRFLPHAGQLVRTLARAQQDIGLPKKFTSRVVLGARFGLWEGLLMEWFCALRADHPSVSYRAEIGFEPELMQGLVDGRIDIGIMFTPQRRPNLKLSAFLKEHLILVSSMPNGAIDPETYIHIDWGPEFDDQFSASFPEFPSPAVTVNIGWLGLNYLKHRGGCGYFPRRLVDSALAVGCLHVVRDAPEFILPAWVLVREDRDKKLIDPMIESLLVHLKK